MPLIRKKTSKRTTTHKRERLKHKVKEGKRKKRKEAKKNPQWKSKKKKDPGIPNNFPFKDEILAEIAEERRLVEEGKKKRKEEKKLAKEGVDTQGQDASMADELTVASTSTAKSQDEAPLLLNPELPHLRAVLDKSHVVLCILDARDPLSFRVSHIEDLVSQTKDAKFAFILNKIDLVPKESVIGWLKYLRSIYPTFAFRSASAFLPKIPSNPKTAYKGKSKENEDDALGCGSLLEYLNQCMADLGIESLRVAVVGITNVGKSSIVNSLVRKATIPVYEYSTTAQAWTTTTTRAYEVEIPRKNIVLIDTPGLSFQNEKEHGENVKIRDMLTRRRGRVDKVKEPIPPIQWIVSRANTQDLMVHYNLPAFSKGDAIAFISGVARALSLIRKGGELDYTTAARSVLRDWNAAKLPIYTEAPTLAAENENQVVLSEKDEATLAHLKTRKEMRKEGGLVKFEGGNVEDRLVTLDAAFLIDEDDEEEGFNDDGEEEDGEEEGEEEEDSDEGESEDDEENEETQPGPRKRKASGLKALPPPKKVAFAAGVADHNEKKSARKLQQQRKERQKAKPGSSRPSQEAGKPQNDKPKSSVTKVKSNITKPSNKGSAKASQVTDPDAYDFDQFFKKA